MERVGNAYRVTDEVNIPRIAEEAASARKFQEADANLNDALGSLSESGWSLGMVALQLDLKRRFGASVGDFILLSGWVWCAALGLRAVVSPFQWMCRRRSSQT